MSARVGQTKGSKELERLARKRLEDIIGGISELGDNWPRNYQELSDILKAEGFATDKSTAYKIVKESGLSWGGSLSYKDYSSADWERWRKLRLRTLDKVDSGLGKRLLDLDPKFIDRLRTAVINNDPVEWQKAYNHAMQTHRKLSGATGTSKTALSLKRQARKLTESLGEYTEEMARSSYESWLRHHPEAMSYKADPRDGSKWGKTKQSDLWWRKQTQAEKLRWQSLAESIQTQNNGVYSKYINLGKVAPSSELIQWHHLMPKHLGGIHTPENIMGAMGNAITDRASKHSRLHETELYKKLYASLAEKGHDMLAFDVDKLAGWGPDKLKRFQNMLSSITNLKGGQGGFGKVGLLTTLAGGGTALGLGGLLATEEGRAKAMETLGLLGVPQEKMFEGIYKLQGQGGWKGDRRIDAGDIVQNAMGQDWMARNPRLYAGLSTIADIGIDPINAVGGGLLKAGVSGWRRLRNIWD